MNLATFSLNHRTTTLVLTAVLLLAGWSSFSDMSRLEDPEFTIKDALILTPYPGASAEEVEEEVTDEIEKAVQQLSQLDELLSKSERGQSTITVTIKDHYDAETLPQVWDELRRKVSDAQSNLPPGSGPSIVIDDYGDVFGVYLVLHGDEFSYAELRETAEYLKRELLLVEDVARIELHGQRTEAIMVEPKRDTMAQIGISPQSVLNQLVRKNVVQDTGRVRVGREYLAIDPTGEINEIEDFEALTFSHQGHQLHLRDIANIRRGYVEPVSEIVRHNGHNGIAIGISTISGGNVVRMGEALDKRLAELQSKIPLGMEIGVISHQSTSVTQAIDGFTSSLLLALGIVVAVLLLFMGMRSGLLIGLILMITIIGSFIFLKPMGVALERISLGALIISLGMLVDNAIVVVDGMLVGMKRGRSAFDAAIDTVRQSALPLLGATAIAVFAFAAIGTTDNAAGEFCRSLFLVICVSLFLSWVTAVTLTPLLGVMILRVKPSRDGSAPFSNRFYQIYRSILATGMRFRWITVLTVIALFVSSLAGFRFVKQSFFPSSTRPQFMVDLWVPQGSHIEETTAEVKKLEEWLRNHDEVQQVTSIIGRGAQRFLLTYAPELPNPSYAQLLVDVSDPALIDSLIRETESHLEASLPDGQGHGIRFELGPGGKGKIQARVFGPDPSTLRRISEEVAAIMESTPTTKAVRTDWRQQTKLLRPMLAEERSNILGIDKAELSQAIRRGFDGQAVGIYREGDLLLPVIVRAPREERTDVNQVDSLQIWSPVANRHVPLQQVFSGITTLFEDEIRMRYNRKPMITISCDPTQGTANELLAKLRPKIESIPLPDGYEIRWFGEYKNSADANASLAEGLPLFGILMLLTTVALFNSIRQPLVIWLCVPLALIGVTAGLLITGRPFSFMALLGFLSLSGMLIKNAIVMVDEINVQLSSGKKGFQAVIDAAASRLMPVAMAASTTALGLIPLLFDGFFASMAVTIVFGLMCATVLTTLVLPVFYVIIFRIKTPARSSG